MAVALREAWGWLAVGQINILPDITRGEDPCCAACCGPCGALIALLDAGTLSETLWAVPDVFAHDWWNPCAGEVDAAYLHARITLECPGHSFVNGVRQPAHA